MATYDIGSNLTIGSYQLLAQNNINVLGDNISNASTAGYKQTEFSFQSALSTANMAVGNSEVFTQGSITNNSNPMDVAINGNGFFVTQTLNGQTNYTRDGQFTLDPSGNLMTSTGQYVIGTDGKMINPSSLAAANAPAAIGTAAAPTFTGFTMTATGGIAITYSDGSSLTVPAPASLSAGVASASDLGAANAPAGTTYTGFSQGSAGTVLSYSDGSTTTIPSFSTMTGVMGPGADPNGNGKQVLTLRFPGIAAPTANAAVTAVTTASGTPGVANPAALTAANAALVAATAKLAIVTAASTALPNALATAADVTAATQVQTDATAAVAAITTANTTPTVANWAAALTAANLVATDSALVPNLVNVSAPTGTSKAGFSYNAATTTLTWTNGNGSTITGITENTAGLGISSTGELVVTGKPSSPVAGSLGGAAGIALVNFQNPNGLAQTQPGVWQWTASASAAPPALTAPGDPGLGVLQSSALESSNADVTALMVQLLEAQRQYQATAQALKTADQDTQTMINLR
ncbi:flagellar hook-basal body complex protein [Candidatus Methylospira mobilis]|uniref:Flagellar hook-basal body complex protein n=1 Tax=Candidatus Methylospira mobilis TaxID=1808979 RepID=A0A5Q0BKY9_9GAMM|nr:flagellar hook-basal body complex protein [Candidatus Methylospira mobilis]QFY42436.1 flagellar hook-basal body complex protein [Candidatus Methylospira mobilis]